MSATITRVEELVFFPGPRCNTARKSILSSREATTLCFPTFKFKRKLQFTQKILSQAALNYLAWEKAPAGRVWPRLEGPRRCWEWSGQGGSEVGVGVSEPVDKGCMPPFQGTRCALDSSPTSNNIIDQITDCWQVWLTSPFCWPDPLNIYISSPLLSLSPPLLFLPALSSPHPRLESLLTGYE